MKHLLTLLLFISTSVMAKVCIVHLNFIQTLHQDVKEYCSNGDVMSVEIINGQMHKQEWERGLHQIRTYYCDHKYEINYEYGMNGKSIFLDCIYKENR